MSKKRKPPVESEQPAPPVSLPVSSDLIDAAGRGDTDRILARLEAGAEVDECFQDGFTPLMAAVNSGSLAALNLLLDRGADVGRADRHGKTAVMYAAESGPAPLLDRLVAAGGDPSGGIADPLSPFAGWTPLMFAVDAKNAETIGFLLGKGVALDAVDGEGETVLMKAAALGDTATVRACLEAGADPLASNLDGQTALAIADLFRHREVADLLVRAEARARAALSVES